MGNLKDFVIKEGVLDKYIGNEQNVVLPQSVKTVQLYAFENCTELVNVTIPAGVIHLYRKSFDRCTNLESITVDEDNTEFKSIDGVLYSKDGKKLIFYPEGKKDSNFQVPNHVTEIDEYAFKECKFLKKVNLSNNLKYIEFGAFENCDGLNEISIPSSVVSIATWAFGNCRKLKKVFFEKGLMIDKETFIYTRKDLVFEFSKDFCKTSNKIFHQFYQYLESLDALDYAYLWIYQSVKNFEEWFNNNTSKFDVNEVCQKIVDVLLQNKKVTPKQLKRFDEFNKMFSKYLSSDIVSKEKERLQSGNGNVKNTLIKIENDKKNQENKEKENEKIKETIPFEKYVSSLSNLWFPSELDIIKEGIQYKDYPCESSVEVVKLMLRGYIDIWNNNKTECHGSMSNFYQLKPLQRLYKPENGEKIAPAFEPDVLSDYLWKLADGKNYRYFCIPYARFATEESMQMCVKEIAKKKKATAKESYWAENLTEAIYYSDTRAASDYIEKYGDFERYARLRGMSVQEYRDRYALPDFGFDSNGNLSYIVDGKTINVSINNKFELVLTEAENGKIIKSISKKTEDGKNASEAYTKLKKELNDFFKKRIEYMKKIYITAEKISEELWNDIYMKNPIFRPIVESLIWKDENKNIFVVENGVCKSISGDECEPLGSVSIAHVFDMTKKQIKEWQDYLIANKKSLLIEQVWEPVAEIDNLTSILGRYNGVVVRKQERNELKKILKSKAIDMKSKATDFEFNYRTGQYVFDPNGMLLIGDHLTMRYVVNESDGDITLGFFNPFKSNEISKRELNTIIFEFDRISLKSTIAKDDVSKLTNSILSTLTFAQVVELIEFSAKNNSTSCTALLMDYKNKVFGETDIFDMLILI